MSSDPWSSVIDGIFGLAGGGLAMTGSAIENKKQRKFAAAEAQKARDWAERMSNTAHQREVDDLRAAGLNPILSATGGNGATTPTAATASSVSTQSPLSEGLSKAIAVFNTIKDGELKTATAKKADADAEKAAAETRKADAEARKASVEATAVEDLDKGARSAWDSFKDLFPSGLSDLPHYFGIASNAGDVERHQRSLEDKKEHNRLLEQERISNAPVIDPPHGDADGDEFSSGVPNDWTFVRKTEPKRVVRQHFDNGGSSWSDHYYDVYKKPDGDFVRVRRVQRGITVKKKWR